MKQIFIVLLLYFLVAINGLSQIKGCYSYFIDRASHDECKLCLFNNGYYYLGKSDHVASDIVQVLVWSMGRYIVNNQNNIVLEDVTGFKMELNLIADKVMFVKSFKWLLDKKFVLNIEKLDSESSLIDLDFNINALKKEREDYNRVNKRIFKLKSKVYKNEYGYTFYIIPNSKYVLKYRGVILSEGVIKRNRNELILFDTSIKYNFYLLIGDGYLISKLIPGDYRGGILK